MNKQKILLSQLIALKNFENDTHYIIEIDKTVYIQDCKKHFYFQSNNDCSEKNIAIFVKNNNNIIFDFQNKTLLLCGKVTAFVLDNCSDVKICNVKIDYERTFFSQGEIISAENNILRLNIDKELYPYSTNDKGELIFEGKDYYSNINQGINLFLEFDKDTHAPAYNSILMLGFAGKEITIPNQLPGAATKFFASEENGLLCLKGDFVKLNVGNILVITHERRDDSGIFLTNCKNIVVKNVSIFHSSAMGVIAQMTENIELVGLKIIPSQKRMISVNCDATHFVNCFGKIIIKDCIFEGMMDDGGNVHGIYTKITKVAKNIINVKAMHFQQKGIDIYSVGDEIAIFLCGTNENIGNAKVVSVNRIDDETIELILDKEIETVAIDDIVENLSKYANVEIDNVKVANNRPRGFLLTTRGKTTVRNCHFKTSGFGIHIAGDTGFWYESSSVSDILIENNFFDNCCYHMCEFAIGITPEYKPTDNSKYFHKNIKILNNEFEIFTGGIVYAYGVDGLVVKNNKIKKVKTFPSRSTTKLVEWDNCLNLDVEE